MSVRSPVHRRIRVALIGYGLGGRYFHSPMIAVTPDMELAIVVTSNAARAAEAASDHPGVRIVVTADDLWQSRDDVDLAVISTANRAHVPLAMQAIDAGLHVVVDKPIAPSAAEARSLIAAAERRGIFLSVYQNRRWDGDFRTIQRLLADEALGTVHRFESRFERWRPAPRPGWRESSAPEDAGGLLYDIGTHLIDQAIVLFGPVTDVYAELRALRTGVQVDDDVFVALTHASGVQSHLWTTLLAARGGPRFRVLGDHGSYTKHGLDVQEDALRRGQHPGGTGWGVEPETEWGTLDDGTQSHTVPTERGAYQEYYAGVARALRGAAPTPVDPRDAVAVLEVIERARRQAGSRSH